MACLGEEAQLLLTQGPGQDERHVEAADVRSMSQSVLKRQIQETSDEYDRVLMRLNPGWRVIECPERLQYIVQRRKKGGAERPWRAVHYCRTRKALQRLCITSCGLLETEMLDLLAALPTQIGAATRQVQRVHRGAPDGQSAPEAALVGALSVKAGRLMSDIPAIPGSSTRRSASPPRGRRLHPVEEARQ